jgi:uncharacterized OB-fold protein
MSFAERQPDIRAWRRNHLPGADGRRHSTLLRFEAEVCSKRHVIFPPRDVCPYCAADKISFTSIGKISENETTKAG